MMKKVINSLIITISIFGGIVSSCQSNIRNEIIFTEDGAWCWFQDPRAIYVKGERERTYAQWITKNGELQIGAYDHTDSKIDTFTLKKDWDIDDHNVGAFLLLPDKRIMVFYARHNKQGIFCRTTSRPEDISFWEEEVIINNSNRITYAHPVYLSDENTYYVFWRGPSWKPTFATSRDGKAWSEAKILLQDIDRDSDDVRPYTKITSDGRSSIHIAFTDGHPRVEPQNSVYYMKYEHGKFFKADGSEISTIHSLPIRHTASDIVYNGKIKNVRAWVWDIALDSQGYPAIAYTRLPKETDHRYCYARWDGHHWLDVELTSGGKWFPQTRKGDKEREQHYSGGISLNHADPSELYLSRPQNGVFEIENWISMDAGLNWESNPITMNSEQSNVRPVVPRGYDGKKNYVLWMYGDYEHYTKYKTGIRLLDFKK